MEYHKMTYVFQGSNGGHMISVDAWDYHSAYKEIMDVLPGARLVDLYDKVEEAV